MSESIDDEVTVCNSIRTGQYDTSLDDLIAHAMARKKYLAVNAGQQLKRLDIVEIVSGRPRYIIGERALVIDIMQTWIKIRFDKTIGKFQAGTTIRCPMSMVKKVEKAG